MSTLNDVRNETYFIGEFGGQKRYVKYDLNAFAEMERIYGSMEKANEALSKGSMQDVRRILWLGLIHDQAVLDEVTGEPIRYNITMYEVGSWLTPNNMKDVMDKLNAAIGGSIPQEPSTPAGLTPAQAQELAKEENNEVIPFPSN